MGNYVHVIKKHAEYGNHEAFNWKFEEFHSFLDLLGCGINEEPYDYEFECEEEAYECAMNIVKSYKEKGDCDEVRQMLVGLYCTIEDLDNSLNKLGGIDNVLESMQAFWDEREKDYGWISFSAW